MISCLISRRAANGGDVSNLKVIDHSRCTPKKCYEKSWKYRCSKLRTSPENMVPISRDIPRGLLKSKKSVHNPKDACRIEHAHICIRCNRVKAEEFGGIRGFVCGDCAKDLVAIFDGYRKKGLYIEVGAPTQPSKSEESSR